jgi:hypothetical protein
MKKLLCLLALLSACQDPSPDTWVMKSYDIPAEVAPELTAALQNVFSRGKDQPKSAQAMLAPNGQLLVTAPRSLIPGIDSLVANVTLKKPPQPASIQLTVWSVSGKRADKAEVPAELKEIAPVLAAIEKSQGGLAFSTIEKLSVRAISGQDATLRGRVLDLYETASERGGVVVADLQLTKGRYHLETRVKIASGKTVVLGQTGGEDGDTVFHVVRADVEAQ